MYILYYSFSFFADTGYSLADPDTRSCNKLVNVTCVRLDDEAFGSFTWQAEGQRHYRPLLCLPLGETREVKRPFAQEGQMLINCTTYTEMSTKRILAR